MFTAYAGQPDMLPSHSGGHYSEADGRVKEIVEQINTTTSQESTESRTKHNTVIGKREQFCFVNFVFIFFFLDPEQLDRLKAHSPVDELDLFRVSSNPLMSPFLASDSALKKMPPISLLVSF